LFGVGAAFNANIINLNLTIPTTATPGLARLRVIMKTANGGIQPNIAPGTGVEIEDYWLNIQASGVSNRPSNISTNMLQNEEILFENPSNGWLKIRNMDQVSQLRIINQVGQLVFEKSYAIHEENDIIDISSQKNGIYFIEVTKANGLRKIEKLLLRH